MFGSGFEGFFGGGGSRGYSDEGMEEGTKLYLY